MVNVVETTWWLDDSALPDRLLWGRIQVLENGTATALHYEFGLRHFPNVDEAESWLREDEFSSLADSIEDGLVEPTTILPEGESLEELLANIVVVR
jgi:hypothetical protein